MVSLSGMVCVGDKKPIYDILSIFNKCPYNNFVSVKVLEMLFQILNEIRNCKFSLAVFHSFANVLLPAHSPLCSVFRLLRLIFLLLDCDVC